MARHSHRCGGPEEGRDAKRTHSYKAFTFKMDRELQERKRSQGGQTKRCKDTEEFQYSIGALKHAEQDLTNWCCLIRKRAAQYEAMRMCKADRFQKEGRARTKGSPSESLF